MGRAAFSEITTRAVLSFDDNDAQRLPTTTSGRAWGLWQGAGVFGLRSIDLD